VRIIFNTREIAILFWFGVLFIWGIRDVNIRESIVQVLILFKGKLLLLFSIETLYFCCLILFLWRIGYWNISFLKDTILWFIFVGSIISFNYINFQEQSNFFITYLKNSITLMILFDFFINFKTFPLIVELILLPLATIIFASKMISERNEEYRIIRKPLLFLELLIGLIVIYSGIKNIFYNYHQLEKIETIKSLFLSPILTILFMPLAYCLILIMEYESIFIRLELGIVKEKKIKRYAKYYIIKECLGNLYKLREVKSMGLYNLMSIKTMEDIEQMRKVYKEKFMN